MTGSAQHNERVSSEGGPERELCVSTDWCRLNGSNYQTDVQKPLTVCQFLSSDISAVYQLLTMLCLLHN